MSAFQRKCLLGLFCLVSFSIQAQKELGEVTVTTTKIPRKQGELSKPMVVISDSVLRAYEGFSVSQILQSQSGIQIIGASQSPGSVQSVFMRGASTGKTLILIDGVPMYDPSFIESNFDLNQIDINDIERIEILKGGQSALYGSDAVAGVINFITRKSSEKVLAPRAKLSYGSFNTLEADLGFSGEASGFSYKAAVNTLKTNGFSSASGEGFEDDGLKRLNYQLELGHKFGLARLGIFARSSEYANELDAGAFTDDKDYIFETKNRQVGVKASRVGEKSSVYFTLQRSNIERVFEDDSTDVPVTAFSNYSYSTYGSNSNFAELYGSFNLGENWQLLGGADFRGQNMEQTYLSISSFGPFEDTPIEAEETQTENFSIYSSVFGKIGSFGGIEASGRFNNHSVYGGNYSYAVNPFVNIGKATKLYAVYGRSFKNPSLYQLFSPYGNQELTPESANTFDLGLKSHLMNNRVEAEVVYFNRSLQDQIIFLSTDSPPYGQYVNQDMLKTTGFEVNTSIGFDKGRAFLNYTFVKADIENTEFSGLTRIPNHQWGAGVNYTVAKKLSFLVDAQYIGERFDRFYNSSTFETEQINLNSYLLVNAGVDYRVLKKLSIYAKVQNLLNSEYQEVYGFNSQPINFKLGLLYR